MSGFSAKNPSFQLTAGVSRTPVVPGKRNSRREVVGGFVLGLAALLPSTSQAKGPTNIEIFDDRKVKVLNDVIYDAMDQDLDFRERDGLVQAISGREETKKRLVAQKKFLESYVKPQLDSSVWWEASAGLRREVGSMRYDISALAETLPKPQKRSVLLLKKKLFEEMEEFDNACGQGIRPELADKALALKQYAKLKATFDQVISAVA